MPPVGYSIGTAQARPGRRGSLFCVTASGEPPSGAEGVNEPDWIDQILERATSQVEAASSGKRPHTSRPSLPVVPETTPNSPPEEPDRPAEPVVRRMSPRHDELAEIRWADTPEVTPAGTPIATPHDNGRGADEPYETSGLVPEAVGRSAWDRDLADAGSDEPDGWDQLSWTDLDDDSTTPGPREQEPTSFGRLLREWGPVLVAAVAIALFFRLVLVQAYHIPSASMVPTLHEGDRVVVNRLSYQFGEIERGQVVVFEKPPGTEGENDLIKRVIGLPGETVRFVDEQVYIDGLRVEEPYLLEQNSTRPRGTVIPGCAQPEPATDRCLVPEGFVFVMGDNRMGSSDSRVFGPIDVDTVVGRAFLRVWPLNHIGQL